MKIETAIKRADFKNLVKISFSVIPSLSFWGTRRIQAVGYQDRAPIDSLASRVMELVKSKNFEYTQEERDMGTKIAAKINKLYNDSDKQVANSNLLTRLFCALKSIYYMVCSPYVHPTRSKSPVRWAWDENVMSTGFQNVFHYYTKAQYTEKFDRKFNGNRIYDWSEEIDLEIGYDLVEAGTRFKSKRVLNPC